MRDKWRWRYGDTNPVIAAVDSTTVIELSDLVWQDVDDIKPASEIKKYLSPIPNDLQKAFADNFLGVAMQRSCNGDTGLVRVAITGVFEFDCDVGGGWDTFELGDLIGDATILHPGHPDCGDGAETPGLMNQAVEKVTSSRYAIGRVAKREFSPVTRVLVDIRSTVMTGGVAGSSREGK